MGRGKGERRGGWRGRKGKRQGGDKATSARGGANRLSFEALEDRRMLAVYVVSNTSDVMPDGSTVFGSLRWAIEQANAQDNPDSIVFLDSVFVNDGPTTISLTGINQIVITQPLQIIGPSAREVTIQQNRGNRRVFDIDDGMEDRTISVQISGVTLSGGNITGQGDDRRGGAIRNAESLTMVEAVIENNSASAGGGGIWNQSGSVTIDRSLIRNNFGGLAGGGIFNGGPSDENRGNLTIRDSTISGNTAAGSNDTYAAGAYGGGIFNRKGTLRIISCTISENTAAFGYGVAGFGDPVDDMGAATEDNGETEIFSSIIWGNADPMGMMPSDVASVGLSEGDPAPVPNISNVTTLGLNILGPFGNVEPGMMGFSLGTMQPITVPMGAPPDLASMDPLLLPLSNYGGAVDVYLLDPMSHAIDAGDASSDFDGRGRHFVRAYNYTNKVEAIPDVGAVEMQRANFVVDHLLDELDGQSSRVFYVDIVAGLPLYQIASDPYGTGGGLGTHAGTFQTIYRHGDFSLREALRYSRLNPEVDTITFNLDLVRAEPQSSLANPPTIRLTQGVLTVDHQVVINGPKEFVLEIDASGNDPTPAANDGNGTRVINVTPQGVPIEIKNLTLMGADIIGRGGGLQNRANLLLSGMTIKDNSASDDGGGMIVLAGNVRIENSTFKGNNGADDGGGLVVDNAQANVLVFNSTFSGNIAGDRGGAIVNERGVLTVEHSTITLNAAATGRGSGIWNATAAAVTNIYSSIISGNIGNDVEFNNLSAPPAQATGFTSQGFNVVGTGNAVNAGRFNATGDQPNITNPMLGPLVNTGGIVETHRPLIVTAGMVTTYSPAIDKGPQAVTDPFLITPTTVTSNKAGTDDRPAGQVINDTGLGAGPVTLEDYRSRVHVAANAMNSWRTADSGSPGGSYFDDLPPTDPLPALTFELPDIFALNGMVLWGLNDPLSAGDEPLDMIVEFSIDGGMTFIGRVEVQHQVNGGAADSIDFGGTFFADAVKVTIVSNHVDSFNVAGGGERVAFGEIKFTNAHDQRGFDFARVFDGNSDGVPRMDVGAYELQSSVFVVSSSQDENDGNITPGNLSLREAIQLANDNPLLDTIRFDLSQIGSTISLGGVLAPNTTADMKITQSVKIEGPGSQALTINVGLSDPNTGEGRRAFTIDDNDPTTTIDVEISGLVFTGAATQQVGGVILSHENLTLRGNTFINNRTTGDGFHGGAIYAAKPAGTPIGVDLSLIITDLRIPDPMDPSDRSLDTVTPTLITGNSTSGINADGGAIYASDVRVSIEGLEIDGVLYGSDTTISGNATQQTLSNGGAIYIRSSVVSSQANFDNDTDVDGWDFLAWQRNMGATTGAKPQGDATGDALVNAADLASWKNAFGSVTTQPGVFVAANTSITGNVTNSTESDGGGIFSEAGEMLLIDSTVSSNTTSGANSEGGGIAAVDSLITLTRSVMGINRTTGTQSPGGGVHIRRTGPGASNLILNNSIISQNVTQGINSSGGGIAVAGATVITNGSAVRLNEVNGSGSHGGGIANLSGVVRVDSSEVSGNKAKAADSRGGGIYSDTNLLGTQATIVLNSTISGNSAVFRGGGVFNADGRTEVHHSTVTNNSTPFLNLGSGIASQGNNATSTYLRSSIVAGNVGSNSLPAPTGSDVDFVDGAFVNSFQSGGFNVIGVGNAIGAFNAAGDQTGVINPLLGPLADNGGNWPLFNPHTHAIQAGSPAINAGGPHPFNPNIFSPALNFDQRGTGFSRVQMGRIDVGAFESAFAALAAAESGGSSTADPAARAVLIDSEARPAHRPSIRREPQPFELRQESAAVDAWLDGDSDVAAQLVVRSGAADQANASEFTAEEAAFELLGSDLDG